MKKRKTYVTLLRCEDYERLLGLESSIEAEGDPSATEKDKGKASCVFFFSARSQHY